MFNSSLQQVRLSDVHLGSESLKVGRANEVPGLSMPPTGAR